MRNKFSNNEKKILLYAGFLCLALLVTWIIFAPGHGIFDLFRANRELQKIQAENTRLKNENRALQEEIDRLQNDSAYLEEKARKEFNMLKENEMLYIFKKK